MHSVRNDTASLLQTVYLAEIGIQSLQDCLKGVVGGGVDGGTPLPPMPPLLEGGVSGGVESTETDGGVAGGGATLNNYAGFGETPPPAKKQ